MYFTEYFQIDPKLLKEYGALNISLINDLPLFVDPFLLYTHKNTNFKKLHDELLEYIIFLKRKSKYKLSEGLIKQWYYFPEVSQNWLGFSETGNKGRGLGSKFAKELKKNLPLIFKYSGKEKLTEEAHLETITLFNEGVGRDMISDFTVNLIKEFLLNYTSEFTKLNIKPELTDEFSIQKVKFDYITESWLPATFILPKFQNDYILLSPKSILTKDNTWINRANLYSRFNTVISSLDNEILRAKINRYLTKLLPKHHAPTQKQFTKAVKTTIQKYPICIDQYISIQERKSKMAIAKSKKRVNYIETLHVDQVTNLNEKLATSTKYFDIAPNSYKEALSRISFLKQVIEKNDGYKSLYYKGKPIKSEKDIQLIFKLVWYNTIFDVNAEPNNGRGPVDFKISYGSKDKTLIEFKLAKNSQLKKNMKSQLNVYKSANETNKGITIIVFFTKEEEARMENILVQLKIENSRHIIRIDARKDNKKSASKV